MLHLIFQLPVLQAVLDRISMGDDVVFLDNAVYQLQQGGVLNDKILKMAEENINLYALKDELEVRSVDVDNYVSIMSYSDLVELTEKNKLIKSWN